MKLLKYEEYSSKVNLIFKKLKLELLNILPFARVEHIGSSSVLSSLSKGDLDVFVGVEQEVFEEAIELVKTIGFTEKTNTFRSNELCMLITDKYNYDVAVQIVVNGSEFEDFIKFRDSLRSDSKLVQAYNDIKVEASVLSEEEYRAKKAGFIQRVLGDSGF